MVDDTQITESQHKFAWSLQPERYGFLIMKLLWSIALDVSRLLELVTILASTASRHHELLQPNVLLLCE